MRVARIWAGAAIAAVALPLAGCSHVPDAINPVAWYNDATGQNNPEDVNQRNQQNLEAGSKEPYPNLSTVPNVPSVATSTADREKLVQSLVADRTNAKYNNEQLQAGRQLASIAPPPPPVKLGPPGAPATAAVGAPPVPSTPPPAAPATAPPTKASAPPPKPAPIVRGQEAPPMESTLTSPTVPTVPKGKTPPPPPPPAKVTSSPPPTAPSVAPATPSPPPAPQLATTPPPAAPAGVRGSHPSLAMRTPATTANPITVSVGDIVFGQESSDLVATQQRALTEIAGLYKQTGGEIRIVGHAAPGRSSDAMRQRIAGLDLALDRANAVAQALSKLGVPARDIRVEATPATAKEQPRAEVFMEY